MWPPLCRSHWYGHIVRVNGNIGANTRFNMEAPVERSIGWLKRKVVWLDTLYQDLHTAGKNPDQTFESVL